MKHKILILFLFLMLLVLQQDISVCESSKEITDIDPTQIEASCETKKIKNFLADLDTTDRIVLFSYLAFAGTIIYLLCIGK